MHGENQWLARELDDGHQVLHRVEGERVQVRARDQRVGRGEDRVSVSRQLGNQVGADIAARAGAVLHQEGLAKVLRQPFAQDAGDKVERAAGREGDDDTHRLGGPGLRLSRNRKQCQGEWKNVLQHG